MKIKPIETWYNGIKFRSRLEATWAAFFDLCGWTWMYEPFTLEGWCPDFEITTNKGWRRMLVEVKPFNMCDLENVHHLYTTAYKKALNHEQDFDILLLGTSVFGFGEVYAQSAIGYLFCQYPGANSINADVAAFKPYGMGVSHYYDGWNSPLGNPGRKDFDDNGRGFDMWNEAIYKTRTEYKN